MNSVILILTGILGATVTFYVSHSLKQGAVRASALLSLIVGLFFYFFPSLLNVYLTTQIPIIFIGTSFIGMISSEAKKHYGQLATAGVLFSIIYINKNHLFDGFGGALGALAFIALLASLAFSFLFSKVLWRIQVYLRYRKNK
ncbi:hypothetical protein KO500_08210 [Cellulophaga baltica]|uniref:hypothetical protein n=1 Tax=Cellulophaga TaxID=104264 RepID=UPI001C065B93|nr:MULTISPECIES: hypothetical protein [Cellulophaga]MBU2996415.1 hypothetical protein [Cellulophaga baltica]MDO6767811.1 hypothetical protein [Cellulophaga sp. 1_MG-2023]